MQAECMLATCPQLTSIVAAWMRDDKPNIGMIALYTLYMFFSTSIWAISPSGPGAAGHQLPADCTSTDQLLRCTLSSSRLLCTCVLEMAVCIVYRRPSSHSTRLPACAARCSRARPASHCLACKDGWDCWCHSTEAMQTDKSETRA
jgi:hypothetical protein